MLFNCGIGIASLRCDHCEKVHHLISIGEETIVCTCGTVIAFRDTETCIEYYTISRRACKTALETAIDADKRNLC